MAYLGRSCSLHRALPWGEAIGREMAADRPSKLTSRLAEKRSTMIALTASAASRTSMDVCVRIASEMLVLSKRAQVANRSDTRNTG